MLVEEGFYDDTCFFRVVRGFVAQFGISGYPTTTSYWSSQTISDDIVKNSNRPGTVTFATSGKDTRTTQLFINLQNNQHLDAQGFSPIGEIVAGMDVIYLLYSGYGEGPPDGYGPDQRMIQSKGNAYLDESFPKLSRIIQARMDPNFQLVSQNDLLGNSLESVQIKNLSLAQVAFFMLVFITSLFFILWYWCKSRDKTKNNNMIQT